jgi:hypothetical protein
MALNNPDGIVVYPKYQNWSYQPITFSRASQWANIPELGRFPLVLDPIIRNVRFEKVLIDVGSALDILFCNALTELDIKPEDLEPYDAPFWGVLLGLTSQPLGRSHWQSSSALPTTFVLTTSISS